MVSELVAWSGHREKLVLTMPPQRLKDKVEQSKRDPQNKSRIQVERYYEPSVGTGRYSDRIAYSPEQIMRKPSPMSKT